MASRSTRWRFRKKADNVALTGGEGENESESETEDNIRNIRQRLTQDEGGSVSAEREGGKVLSNVCPAVVVLSQSHLGEETSHSDNAREGQHIRKNSYGSSSSSSLISEQPETDFIDEAEDVPTGQPANMLGDPNRGLHVEEVQLADAVSTGDELSDFESESYDETDDVSSSESDDEIRVPAADAAANNNLHEEDNLLYNGAPLTLCESLTAIMTFVLTHALTGSCLVDLLTLIALHCPPNSLCVRSLYKFKKFFRNVGNHILVYHYYCSTCFELLQDQTSNCTKCTEASVVSFFIEIPLLYQIQTLFKRPGFLDDLQFRFTRTKKHPDNIEDIYDGRIYKEHVQKGILNQPHHISFMWYSDGISVFKFSNKFSIWPLYLVINELSYKKRVKKQNIILAGLWFGAKKPQVNTFLAPFHTEMKKFYSDGYMIEIPNGAPICVKGVLLCGTCDMPAKSAFMRFIQFNGFYGCPKCKAKGEQWEPDSNVHVYPFSENVELRTNDEVELFARVAVASGGSCYGVKGLSLLYRMLLDMVRSTGIDEMHGVFSGVSKLLLQLWFDKSNQNMDCSLYHLYEIVDNRLKSFKPPSFLNRFPQSVVDLTTWKSLDFKVWLLYYSIPTLLGLMSQEYMDHHMLLVSAVYLLSQRSISHEQIERASYFVNQYVKNFQQLYSLRFMGINIHQLIHLPDVVLDLGPLWVYSCYFLEDLNGKICHLIHGSRHVGIQIASATTIMLELSSLVNKMADGSPVRKFCNELQKVGVGNTLKKSEEVVPGIFVIGKFSAPTHVPGNILLEYMNLRGGKCQLFARLWDKGVLYVAECYTRVTKRQSSFVSFTLDGESCLGSVKSFIRWSECHCTNSCLCQPAIHLCIIQLYERIAWEAHQTDHNVRLSYISAVKAKEKTVAVPISMLCRLCFHLTIDDKHYIIERVNDLEAE